MDNVVDIRNFLILNLSPVRLFFLIISDCIFSFLRTFDYFYKNFIRTSFQECQKFSQLEKDIIIFIL